MCAAPTPPVNFRSAFWDHWVPGANKASTDLVNEWAEKEKVEVQIDYIPSQGNKNAANDRRRSPGKVRS